VSSLLSVSLEALSDEAHEAVLAFGAMFSSSTTPELLSFCTRRNEDITENALSELQKRGLADRVSEAGSDVISYRLHDLVFSFARANNNLRATTAMRGGKRFLDKHKGHFDVLDAEINNVLGAVEVAKKTDSKLFVEMMRSLVVGNAYYHARGHSPRSFELLKVAVEKAKELGDLDAAHHLVAKVGNIYREFYGDLGKALKAFEEALELARKLTDYHREAVILSLIGVVKFEQKAKDAEKYLENAYKLSKSKHDDLALNTVLQNMSYVAGVTENHKRAREISLESVEVAQRLAFDTSVEKSEIDYALYFSTLNLGVSEHRLGCFENALTVYQDALNLARKRNNELWVGYVLQEMGELYHSMANRDLAQETLNRALNLYRQNSAKSDEETLENFILMHGYMIDSSHAGG
jgi:tetratricopeptide (TPR) repeat protein